MDTPGLTITGESRMKGSRSAIRDQETMGGAGAVMHGMGLIECGEKVQVDVDPLVKEILVYQVD